MTEEIQLSNQQEQSLISEQAIQAASSVLALLHGKTDSICRLYNKDIIVRREDVLSLCHQMQEKLKLHQVNTVTTSFDISLANKEILSFKSVTDFQTYDFSIISAPTRSINIKWDFFLQLEEYKVPQRHTITIRITANPNPSDFFKALLSGGLDDDSDFDIESSTMICKVDFINHVLAQELINVADKWNELCDDARQEKGKVRLFLYSKRVIIAKSYENLALLSFCALFALICKVLVSKQLLEMTIENGIFIIIGFMYLFHLIKSWAHQSATKIHDKFRSLLEIHIFSLTTGDKKESEHIKNESKYYKEVILFIANAIVAFAISTFFFLIQ